MVFKVVTEGFLCYRFKKCIYFKLLFVLSFGELIVESQSARFIVIRFLIQIIDVIFWFFAISFSVHFSYSVRTAQATRKHETTFTDVQCCLEKVLLESKLSSQMSTRSLQQEIRWNQNQKRIYSQLNISRLDQALTNY